MARGRKPMSNFSLHDLEKRVQERARASAQVSYTRRLLDQGVEHCAKKLGEEAIETVLAAVEEDRARLIAEAADLIYHLLVALVARPPRHGRGRGNLSAAVPAPLDVCRGDAAPVPGATEFSRHRGHEGAF